MNYIVLCGSRRNGKRRGVEQWLARWAHNPKVGGSNPSPATNLICHSAPNGAGWSSG